MLRAVLPVGLLGGADASGTPVLRSPPGGQPVETSHLAPEMEMGVRFPLS